MKKRAVFLDRDGTINAMVYNREHGLIDSPANPEEFRLLPRAAEGVNLIHRLGFQVVVVSNQPGIAKGKFTPALLQAITDKMVEELSAAGAYLDAIYYCMHHPEGVIDEFRKVCDCRKPKTGLLLQAAVDLDIDLERSYMVGDGITDLLAGQAAGTTNILIFASSKLYLSEELENHAVQPDYIVKNIGEAAELLEKLEN